MQKIFIVLVLLLAQPAFAQEVVGRSSIEGRSVELLNDGTWRYSDANLPSACRPMASGVSFCGSVVDWPLTNVPNADVTAAFRKTDRNYALLIVEDLGTEDGLTAAFMQETVLAFPAELMGIPVEQVPILDRREDVVDGAAYPTLVYFAEINGLPIVYSNTIASLPRRTVQVLTYAVGKNLTAAMTNIHSEFLAEVRIGGRP